MSHATIGLDQTEEAILSFEVSDAVLERAAGNRKVQAALYTVPSAIICLHLVPARSKDWS